MDVFELQKPQNYYFLVLVYIKCDERLNNPGFNLLAVLFI